MTEQNSNGLIERCFRFARYNPLLTILIFGCALLFAGLSIFLLLVIWYHKHNYFALAQQGSEKLASVGSFFGGMLSPIFQLVTIYLILKTFKLQNKDVTSKEKKNYLEIVNELLDTEKKDFEAIMDKPMFYIRGSFFSLNSCPLSYLLGGSYESVQRSDFIGEMLLYVGNHPKLSEKDFPRDEDAPPYILEFLSIRFAAMRIIALYEQEILLQEYKFAQQFTKKKLIGFMRRCESYQIISPTELGVRLMEIGKKIGAQNKKDV